MDHKILVYYKSVTGFTKRYAQQIADALNCTAIELNAVTAEMIAQSDTVVFGGRMHAGTIDGLKKIKALLSENRTKSLVVFATGAMPSTAKQTIQQAWEDNFTADELQQIPHFYMPGGLCYEKMPLHEKIMMKAFAAVMKRNLKNKKDKTEQDLEIQRIISTSYDISSSAYVKPLLTLLQGEMQA